MRCPVYRLLIPGFCLLAFLSSCRRPRQIDTSFYFWKTVYKPNETESGWLNHFHVHKLYVRIMDVDTDENSSNPVPISPVTFQNKLPDTVAIVPVVFIVNNILKTLSRPQLDMLATHISGFVDGKTKQAGKASFEELQIDCDWTATTRENYFYLLRQLKSKPEIQHKILSATLRLHQLKNQSGSGIPPVDRAMLMCYNMGNLRKYGNQNSILEISELKKYLGHNIAAYPMPVDIGLPLFSWAVAFRNKTYIGISKRIKNVDLINKNQFIFIGNNIYKTAKDLPEFGLLKADEVRWEDSSVPDLEAAAGYLSGLIKAKKISIIYFHLDENVIKAYHYHDLEKVNDLLR